MRTHTKSFTATRSTLGRRCFKGGSDCAMVLCIRSWNASPSRWECSCSLSPTFLSFSHSQYLSICYAGVSSQTLTTIGTLLNEDLGSLFQIGWAYALGIVFAIVCCSATSGGHFNPCLTVCHVLFNKFPVAKGIRYILAQLFGAYVACLLVYAQYKVTITTIEATMSPEALAAIQFTAKGPSGIMANYLQDGASVGLAFLNEFVVDFTIGTIIFAVTDPTNVFVPPVAVPPLIGLAYAVLIWGFGANSLGTNTARDLGGRFAALTIWGRGAVGASKGYAAISALTNIPATVLAFLVYEFMMVDSDRVVSQANREFHDIHALHRRVHAAKHGHEPRLSDDDTGSSSSNEKVMVGTLERV
ncbi:Aquaporin [Mycena chlorophos]|uniref:Aquaporin n=1 Tax=Mycena chlorophos TaxID=658473 RepID=A0A8H6WLW4_MYCCL|nr:Aquaporin [Mycena chlorophos]